jgi:hypothetical protein
MTIATTIIAEALLATTVAGITVSAIRWRSALLQGIQRSQGKSVGMALRHISCSKPFDDLGNFIFRTFHYLVG